MGLAMTLVMPAVSNEGHGYPRMSGFGVIMRQSLWVFYHVAGALALLGGCGLAWLLTRRLTARPWVYARRAIQIAALLFCLGVLAWHGYQTANAAWRVTSRDLSDPDCVEVGQFARNNLPENAVLFWDDAAGYRHLTAMFYTDRTCYPLNWARADQQARQVAEKGGVPYFVTRRNLPLAAVYRSASAGPTVYLRSPRNTLIARLILLHTVRGDSHCLPGSIEVDLSIDIIRRKLDRLGEALFRRREIAKLAPSDAKAVKGGWEL